MFGYSSRRGVIKVLVPRNRRINEKPQNYFASHVTEAENVVFSMVDKGVDENIFYFGVPWQQLVILWLRTGHCQLNIHMFKMMKMTIL